jgi:serine/threonine-protein kinase
MIEHAPAPGAVIGGKLRLERPLARGGMGTVWIARHLQLDVLVAVKFIDPMMASATNARVRFEREAKAAAQIRNPNVVQVFDHGIDESGTPYIVMELLEGEDLGARLKRERRLPLAQVVTLMSQVAKGLRRAHESGIVHRDLKPGNIYMARVEEEEVVKILDFGLAKAFSADAVDDVTVSGVVLGSPHYMSPEQARGSKNLDHRSDIWSLGIILYRCLTGVVPFQGDQVGDLVIKICTERVPPPSKIAPDLMPYLDRFFERALARDPDQRFQNVREMAAELVALAGGRQSIPDLGLYTGPSSGPVSSPLPALSPWPSEPPGQVVDSFRDPLSPSRPQHMVPYGSPDGLGKETTTVPAMVPASPPNQRKPARSTVIAVAGAAFAVTLVVVGLLMVRSSPSDEGSSSDEKGTSPASAVSGVALSPSADPTASAKVPPPSTDATAEPTAAEPTTTLDLDEPGADEPDAGAGSAPSPGASSKPSGPIKKRRNFGY